MTFFDHLFSSDGFMPHGHCYLWRPSVLWLHILSDAFIALAYFSIPFTLVYFVRKRKDLEFDWMFLCFAVFIVACGTTHLMEIWVIWHPTYYLSGIVKLITALASVPTAILLVKLIPDALRLPSPTALRRANANLAVEIMERKRAEEHVRKLNDELEKRVTERTQELQSANQNLEREVAERQQVETALRESENRLRAVLDSALSAVVVISTDELILDWNSRAEAMFGWSRQDALGKELGETIIPLRYREAHRRGLAHFLSTGQGPVIGRLLEMQAMKRGGDEFPVELSISALRTGRTTTFCAFITDLTERKRAEKALRESQQLLQTIVDNALAVIYVKNLEGQYLLVNSRFTELFHLSKAAALGKSDYDVFSKAEADAFRNMDQRVIAAGRALTEEETALHDDGPHTYISVKCPLMDSAGKPYALFGISTDITERAEAERKLEMQLERLDLLSRTTRAIAERQDLTSIFQIVLQSLEEHFPVDFACLCLYDQNKEALIVETLGCKSTALAPELATPQQSTIRMEQDGLWRCIQGDLVFEGDIRRLSLPFPQKLASAGMRSLVLAPLLFESNVFGVLIAARREVDGFSSADCEFLRQLSEHVALAAHQAQLYQALQSAYEDLRQSQQTVMQQERLRALGQMASGIAHDINNALSPVALYTESLLEREPNLTERGRTYLETIQRAIEDVSQTVGRLREFYRPRGVLTTAAPVHLHEMTEQAISLTRAKWSDLAQQRGVVIQTKTEFEPGLPPILGVESEIRDALTNLIFNAVDAMPDGGILTIRTRSTPARGHTRIPGNGMWVEVEVEDTGIGMDDETKRRCLEPFFTTKGERGTGLGLAMVYGVVQRHGGELEIDSKPGQGTCIRLIFCSGADLGDRAEKTKGALPVAWRTRILIVDDDPVLLKSLADTLSADGHVVIPANGGEEALQIFRAARERGESFGVVITDLGMPHMDGHKVAAAIKESSASTPVIMLTGWGKRLSEEGETPAHVDHLLSKPPRLLQLREVLAACRQNMSAAALISEG
jgi:PAS domain S-box-containing protein